jgi:hypothetical protein
MRRRVRVRGSHAEVVTERTAGRQSREACVIALHNVILRFRGISARTAFWNVGVRTDGFAGFFLDCRKIRVI